MASVMELAGSATTPETYMLVLVAEVAVRLVTVSLTMTELVAKRLVEVTEVPDKVVKVTPPLKVPPASNK